MRILPRMALSLLLGAGVVACAESDRPDRTTGDTTDDTMSADQVRQPPRPGSRPETEGVRLRRTAGADSVISIRLDGQTIVVTPTDAYIRRGRSVRWTSVPTDTPWVVAFAGATPFQNGKRVFNGGGPGQSNTHGPLLSGAALGSHEYTVLWPDGEGGFIVLDPKLVVVDEMGDTTHISGQ